MNRKHGLGYVQTTRSFIYYPPEVSSMKYCQLGVFRKEYFRLVTKYHKKKKYPKKVVQLGSKNNKHLRGTTQATLVP